jgi:hypothetical protein
MALDLEGELGDVVTGERAIELLFKLLLEINNAGDGLARASRISRRILWF